MSATLGGVCQGARTPREAARCFCRHSLMTRIPLQGQAVLLWGPRTPFHGPKYSFPWLKHFFSDPQIFQLQTPITLFLVTPFLVPKTSLPWQQARFSEPKSSFPGPHPPSLASDPLPLGSTLASQGQTPTPGPRCSVSRPDIHPLAGSPEASRRPAPSCAAMQRATAGVPVSSPRGSPGTMLSPQPSGASLPDVGQHQAVSSA